MSVKKILNACKLQINIKSIQVLRIAGQRLLEQSKLPNQMAPMISLLNTCGFHKQWLNAPTEITMKDSIMSIADYKGNKLHALLLEKLLLSSKQIRSAYQSLDTSSKAETIQLSQSEQIDRYHLAKVER